MLTVVTPTTSTRLTTVAAVRSETGVTATEMDDDAVGALIDEASGLVAGYCSRVFGRETVKETLRGPFKGPVILSRIPVASVAEVMLNGTVQASDTYSLDPATGFLYRVSGTGLTTWPCGLIEVTYTAGFLLPGEVGRDLPAMVERATVLVASAIRSGRDRDPLIKSETVEDIGRTDYFVPGATTTLPHPSAGALLAPYVMRALF